MAHSYKTILKKIILKLGFGFKKDRIEACLGDEIPLQLDEKLFEGNVKRAKKTTKKNSLVRWSTEDGSEIKDSKTIHDDDGTTYTRSSDTTYLMHQTENTGEKPNDDAIYECITSELGGTPQFILGKRKQQNWISSLNREDKSFSIKGQNLVDPTKAGEYLRINTAGNVTFPNQYTAYATLTENTGGITNNTEYYLGQGTPLTVIINKGGYFFAGAGNVNNPAKYTVFEKCTLLVYISGFITTDLTEQTEVIARIRVSGSLTRSTSFLVTRPGSVTKGSAFVQNGVLGLPGDIIKFTFFARSGNSNQKWRIIKELGDTYTTFIGIRCLG